MSLKILTVQSTIVSTATNLIGSCETCDSRCDVPFSWFLEYVAGGHDEEINYFMSYPALCPKCGADVYEETLVRSKFPVRQSLLDIVSA